MEKKDLIKLLDEMFIPIGFKRKGNNWVHNGEIITKIIICKNHSIVTAFILIMIIS